MSTTTTAARPKTLQVKIERVATETGVSVDAVATVAELEGATTLATIRQAVADHAASSGAEPATASVHQMLRDAGLTAASARAALEQAEITASAADAEPTAEMRQRAENRAEKKGLSGKALGIWILTGESPARRAAASRPDRSTSTSSATDGPREGSTLAAALTVLKDAGEPLSVPEIFKRITERKLAPGLKGKTPQATLSAQISTAVKKGKHGLTRPEAGRYAVKV